MPEFQREDGTAGFVLPGEEESREGEEWVVGECLQKLIFEMAGAEEAEQWRSGFAWSNLRHDIIERDLLEKRKEEWQAFIKELLGDGQLKQAVRAQVEAHALVYKTAKQVEAEVKAVLGKQKLKLPLLGEGL